MASTSTVRADVARLFLEVLVRSPFADFGFTISAFLAVAITAAFAFALVFDAPSQVTVSMPVMGLLTAIAEYGMRSRHQPSSINLKGRDESVTSKGYRK
jgi:hypothetical protein